MSKKVLLISIPEIIAGSVIQENVDPKVLSKTLSIVQEVHYKPILGTELYDDFVDAVELKILSGTPLNSVFQGLLDVSKPYLINRTVAEFIVINQYKVTNKGILTMKDNFANNLTEGDLQAVKDLYDNYSTSFKIDLIEYLETSGLKKSDQVNEITSDASGWYLGIETDCNTACDTPTETIPIDYSGLTASPLFSDKKVLIISIPEIISSSIIQENVDQKILTKTLLMVQEIYLRQILKPNLYNFLIDSIYRKVVSGDTLTNGVENLLDVVKPYLINKTVAEFVYVNQYKVSNKGILSMSDTSANNLSESDLQAVKDYYDNVSTTYKINLIEFLECNNLMYKDSEEFSSDATGWYLEGVDTCDNSLGQSCDSIQLDFTGPPGPTGPQGPQGIQGPQGPIGPTGAGGAQGYYGVFYSLDDQILSTNNAVSAMTYSNTAESFGISIQNGSQITVTQQGVYNIEFSAQFHHRTGGGSGEQVEIWFRKNGVDIPDSNTRLIIPNSIYTVASWNFMLSLNANDYVEIVWTTNNSNIALEHVNNSPNIPSVITTIMQVMYTQSGISGLSGISGTVGQTGAQGNSGISGLVGSQGPTGAQGNSGISGLVGPAGSTGAQGTSGISGLLGSQGPTGAQGNSGISGLVGPAGSTGAQGTSGISGLLGSQGPTGAQGQSGISGLVGPAGSTGAQGQSGISGLVGSQGPTGPQGNSGISGLKGLDGNGQSGISGLVGQTGSAGSQGTSGISGLVGSTGAQGNSGISGLVGAAGSTGAQGTSGISGLVGSAGATGSQGVSGISGLVGSTGSQGQSGISGLVGPAGSTGSQGVSGISGLVGSTGAQGQSGISGLSGRSGISGLSGISGRSGISGTVGATGPQGPQGVSGIAGSGGGSCGSPKEIYLIISQQGTNAPTNDFNQQCNINIQIAWTRVEEGVYKLTDNGSGAIFTLGKTHIICSLGIKESGPYEKHDEYGIHYYHQDTDNIIFYSWAVDYGRATDDILQYASIQIKIFP